MIINARKKSYKIHAMQWNGESDEAKLKAFINGTTEYKMSVVSILGLEGEEVYPKGSVIVQGVHGEFYGMREKTFEKKYEHVSGNTYQVKDGEPIECLQYTGKNMDTVMKFSPLAVYNHGVLAIQSRWGNLEAKPGDYITKYGAEDFGVVDRQVFKDTYEPVDLSRHLFKKKKLKIKAMKWNGEEDRQKLSNFINGKTKYKFGSIAIKGLEGWEIYKKGSVIVKG